MTRSTAGTAQALVRALVGAFQAHVEARVAELGADPSVVSGSISEGRLWLVESLEALVAEPFDRQTRSPLELFQEAMRFPTSALAAAGIPPVTRDPVSEAALPGDLYGLAPASSRDLGDEAWHAHLAWGVAKAAALTRPTAGLLSRDLMDRSRVEEASSSAGYLLHAWRGLAEVEADGARPPAIAFVDVTHPDADDAVAMLSEAGVRVLVFGPHIDDFALVRARALGAHDALPRSRFFRTIGELLPPMV